MIKSKTIVGRERRLVLLLFSVVTVIYFGSISIEGTDDIDIKLILGKRLSNRIYLNTQIDIKDFNENQYEAVYQLSRNSSIVGGLNTTEENNTLHLKYRLKYYY